MLKRLTLSHVSLGFVGLMWVVPFLVSYHAFPIPSFYTEWVAAVLGLGAAVVLIGRRVWADIGFPVVALMLLGLVAILLVQLVLGMVPYAQQILLACLYLLWAAAMMMVGKILDRDFGREKASAFLAWALLIGAILNALAGVAQHYGMAESFGFLVAKKMYGQAYGNLGHPNIYADYLGLGLASLLFLFQRRNIGIVGIGLAGALLLFAMALSGSRSSWLYLGAFAVLGVGVHLASGRQYKRLCHASLIMLPAFALVQPLVHLSLFEAAQLPTATPNERLYELATGAGIRWHLLIEAWGMFLQSPWLGIGFGQFPWGHFQAMQAMSDGHLTGIYEHAHNLFLQLLAETGIFSLVIVVLSLAGWAFRALRGPISLPVWWGMAILSVLGIHSMLEYPLWYLNFLGVAAIVFGMLEERTLAVRGGRLWSFVLAAFWVLGVASAFNLVRSYGSMEGLLLSRYHYDTDAQARADLRKGLSEIYQDSLLTPYVELAYTGAIVADRDHLADKLELNTRVMHFAPSSDVVYREAILLALDGKSREALGQLQTAARVFPQDLPNVRRALLPMAEREPETFGPLLEFIESQRKG